MSQKSTKKVNSLKKDKFYTKKQSKNLEITQKVKVTKKKYSKK